MKAWKKYIAFLLAVLMCCALAACGDTAEPEPPADDTVEETTPDVLEDMVKDDAIDYDYSDYCGVWLASADTDYNELEIEQSEDTGEVRWCLYRNEDIAGSGYLQYMEAFDGVYAYNEHDGLASRCVLTDSELYLTGFGTFSYGQGMEGVWYEEGGDGDASMAADDAYLAAVEGLAGIWYLDADLSAQSYIYITEDGEWSLYERAPGVEATQVDYGVITISTVDGDICYADSALYDGVSYEITVLDEGQLVWGGENDYYERME